MKQKISRDDALALLRDSDEIFAAKGKKVLHFDLKNDDPSDDEIASAVLGRSGTLRAPVFKKGRKYFIGFNEEALAELLK